MSSRRRRSLAGSVVVDKVVAKADAPESVTTTQMSPAEILQLDFEGDSTPTPSTPPARVPRSAADASIKNAIIRWLDQQL